MNKLNIIIKNIKLTKNCYLFMDMACSAPYLEIDVDNNIIDAFVFSGHKFFGGVSTPGILIAHENIFKLEYPYNPGGGCVDNADTCGVEYDENIETRESAGTPDIIGIIRFGLALNLKRLLRDIIYHNEYEILKYVHSKFYELQQKYDTLYVIHLNKNLDRRLPIISFCIKNIHHNLIVSLLNDLFGIQTRGGLSCCGLFGEYMRNNSGISGWCRISFNFIMSEKDIKYILKCVEYIIKNGYKFISFYDVEPGTNLYYYNCNKKLNFPIKYLLKKI